MIPHLYADASADDEKMMVLQTEWEAYENKNLNKNTETERRDRKEYHKMTLGEI